MSTRSIRTEPEVPPSRRLTHAYILELINAPGPYDMLVVFANAHPDEFYGCVAKTAPQLYLRWAFAAMRGSPELRRRVLLMAHRRGDHALTAMIWRAIP